MGVWEGAPAHLVEVGEGEAGEEHQTAQGRGRAERNPEKQRKINVLTSVFLCFSYKKMLSVSVISSTSTGNLLTSLNIWDIWTQISIRTLPGSTADQWSNNVMKNAPLHTEQSRSHTETPEVNIQGRQQGTGCESGMGLKNSNKKTNGG